jgi:hypothetical protein
MDLIGNLTVLADLWAGAHREAGSSRVSRKTLGARVLDDAKVFDRLAEGGALNIPRYERLIDYLADAANWPGALPVEAERRLAALGMAPPGWRLVLERDTIERVEV